MNQHPATLQEIVSDLTISALPLRFELVGNPIPSLRHGTPFVRFRVRIRNHRGEVLALEWVQGYYTNLNAEEVGEIIGLCIDLHELLERSELEAYSLESAREWKDEQAHRAGLGRYLMANGNYLN
jgi:hypothetical protein